MSQNVSMIALLVRDYDEAIAYYAGVLGFDLIEDTRMSETKRWVVVRPPGGTLKLLLAQPGNDTQAARVGDQTGGRVFLFLDTTDFDADFTRFKAAGVHFLESPRNEPYGKVAVFEDIYGNKWDLVERC